MVIITVVVLLVAIANLALLLRLNWLVDNFKKSYTSPRAEIDTTVIAALDHAAALAQTVAADLKENLAIQRQEFRRTVTLVDEMAAQLSSLIASEAIAKRDRGDVALNLADAKAEVERVAGNLASAQAEVDRVAGNLVTAQAEVDAVAGNLVDATTKVEGVAANLVDATHKVEGVATDLSARQRKAATVPRKRAAPRKKA